ncbi:hypothetical protein PR003_g22672 [Phytophthora rubi]|uniref:Integrase catalytic domain-containing protein n=1 Tax=Phytophthora rubi TaxID=129364 RepID=A0A6A4D609_9STRA|nr:hypothetical protein PR003_g22672 [Phytophthora rubi]
MPIPRKDVLQNNMAGCTIFSALDMVDGYYQLLMRESDIPLAAVSTPSGMLWEWLVMPQGLSNAPATFNRLVTQLFRPIQQFVQTYFDDIFVRSRLVEALSAPNKAVELTHSRLHRYQVVEGLLYYQVDGGNEPRIVVPNDEDLRHRVLYEAHDPPLSGHLGREKTYTSVVRNFWWPHMYKWIAGAVSMDFIFELPADARGHTGILVFVCRLSKMVRLAAVRKSVTAPQTAQLFVDNVFRHHGLPEAFVSDRDPRFVSHF